MVCEGLKVSTAAGVFFLFYATRTLKGGWVTLGGMLGNPPVNPSIITTRIRRRNLPK